MGVMWLCVAVVGVAVPKLCKHECTVHITCHKNMYSIHIMRFMFNCVVVHWRVGLLFVCMCDLWVDDRAMAMRCVFNQCKGMAAMSLPSAL